MNRIFAYGKLLESRVQEMLRFRPSVTEEATLLSYKKIPLMGGNLTIAIPDSQGEVQGYVLSGISDAELERIDRYEGNGRFYNRTSAIALVRGEPVEVQVYTAGPSYWSSA